jgi:GAF domain-containing protein
MEILNRFTREVSSTLDLNHVLDALVNTLEQDMNFSHVSLDLIDEPANAVRTVRAAGLASGMNDLVRPLDQLQNDITIDVARKGQIEIIDGWDDRFDRELFERAGHAKLVRAFVPLLLRDRTVGVLEVGYQRGERAGILDEEISLLRSLADQVVMAVENARLFEQTRARARREQILRQVTEHIRSSSDPDTVMRTLVSELGTVLNRRTFVRLGSAEQLAQAPVPQESGGNPQGAVPGGQPEAEGGK